MLIGAIKLYHGTIDAVRVNTGQKCAIVWRFMDREVWLDEVPVVGRKLALYRWHRSTPDRAVQAKLARLEGEAADTIDRLHQQALAELGEADLMIEIFDGDEYEPSLADERVAAIAALG